MKPRENQILIHADDGKRLMGMLDFSGNKMTFTGKAEESARIFFNVFLKPLVEAYMESYLKTLSN